MVAGKSTAWKMRELARTRKLAALTARMSSTAATFAGESSSLLLPNPPPRRVRQIFGTLRFSRSAEVAVTVRCWENETIGRHARSP